MKRTLLYGIMGFLLITFTHIYSQPVVKRAVGFRVTQPLRKMRLIPPGSVKRSFKEVPNHFRSRNNNGNIQQQTLGVQNSNGTLDASKVTGSWDGVGNLFGGWPPDTDGDVGINHYFQMINLSFQIWDKQGNSLYGPADNSTLWDGFNGDWTGTNDGDPVVLYDQDADRWLASQFSFPHGSDTPPFYELIAISKTSDPTGEWYQYAFEFDDHFPDYPKLGVWPDGYYMSTNGFDGNSFASAGATVFERDKMLQGDSTARMVYFEVAALPNGGEAGGMLPSDWDGVIKPPAGSPNYFTYFQDDSDNNVPADRLRLWEFHVDWSNPNNSTFTLVNTLNTQAFDSNVNGIKQPDTRTKLDNLSDRLMFRLQYRNFGTYQAMVTNHTVNVSGHAAVRWYEFRNTGSGWSIYQQGTFSPDADNRWMGSIALDGYGNIGLEYCVSSKTTYPSIRYTGRFNDDPLGTMTIIEGTIVAGGGSQQGISRWGDYSAIDVDPNDDATFWATNEYMPTTSYSDWHTRIGAFSIGVDLNLKVFLQGNYSGTTGEMSTTLNTQGYLPIKQPYNVSPWNHNGGELVSDLDASPADGTPDFYQNNPDIVDWILVELRTGTDASTKVAERAGFVKKDGTVVGPDGSSPLRFGVKEGNYYIVVKHRNHIPIMSSAAVSFTNAGVNSYDFTTGSDKYYGTDGAIQIGN